MKREKILQDMAFLPFAFIVICTLFNFIGLFTITCPIMENDTCKKIALRLSRTERNVKDAKKVKLLRYADSNLGPRKMPSSENIDDGKIEILRDEFTFKINLESKQVNLYNGQKAETIELGNAIVYRI